MQCPACHHPLPLLMPGDLLVCMACLALWKYASATDWTRIEDDYKDADALVRLIHTQHARILASPEALIVRRDTV